MSEAKLMRTSMYAGGTSPVKMIQAGFYNEDCLVYDLEDSVSAGEKDAARFLVYNAVKYQRPKDKYILIRVNGIYSKELDEDLEAAMRAQPDAIRIPKVEYAEEVQRIDAKMTAIEEKAGLPIGGVKLWCNIESYLGVIHAQEIATASPRVEAMALGAEDFRGSPWNWAFSSSLTQQLRVSSLVTALLRTLACSTVMAALLSAVKAKEPPAAPSGPSSSSTPETAASRPSIPTSFMHVPVTGILWITVFLSML